MKLLWPNLVWLIGMLFWFLHLCFVIAMTHSHEFRQGTVEYLSLRNSSVHRVYFSSTLMESVFPSFVSHCFSIVHLGRDGWVIQRSIVIIFFLDHCFFSKKKRKYWRTSHLSVSEHSWYLANRLGLQLLWIARPIALYCLLRSDASMHCGLAICRICSFWSSLSFVIRVLVDPRRLSLRDENHSTYAMTLCLTADGYLGNKTWII